MKTRTILVVGGLARRYILEAEELPGLGQTIETTKSSESHTGGRGAFTAVAAHRLSHLKPPNGSHRGTESAFQDLKINVHLVANVGADDIGNSLKERMTECGVNADQVQNVKGSSSSMAMVVVDQATKDHRIWFDAGPNHNLGPEAFEDQGSLVKFAGGTKPALILTTLELRLETAEKLIKTAGLYGVEVLLNVVPSQPLLNVVLRNVTHLIIHKGEARRHFGDCPTDNDDPSAWADSAQQFLSSGAKNVVITLSPQGAYFANVFGASGFVPSDEPEDLNNKVGAGETFIGAYAVEYMKQVATGQCNREGHWNIEAAVRRGCKARNCNLSHEGCIFPLPWANEIDE